MIIGNLKIIFNLNPLILTFTPLYIISPTCDSKFIAQLFSEKLAKMYNCIADRTFTFGFKTIIIIYWIKKHNKGYIIETHTRQVMTESI